MGYFIYKSSNGQWYFVLRAKNSEIIATSELYTTKAGAEAGIASVKANVNAPSFDMSDK